VSASPTRMQRPEEAILRLIRVAEILVQEQDPSDDPAARPENPEERSHMLNEAGRSSQKTQT
jgi:hypothetical protein